MFASTVNDSIQLSNSLRLLLPSQPPCPPSPPWTAWRAARRSASRRACDGSSDPSAPARQRTNVFVKPRMSPFTCGHSSHALCFGPLGDARRTQMRSNALGVIPQYPRDLMLDGARHTSHCESNFGSSRGCPTQRSRVPSAFFLVACRPRLVSLAALFDGCVVLGFLLG